MTAPLVYQDNRDIHAPVSLWRWAPGGNAPPMTSPWGERFQPLVVGRFGLSLYNPYSAGPDNSQRFRQWQFDCARRAVYGANSTGRPILRQPRMQVVSLFARLSYGLVLVFIFQLSFWRRMWSVPRSLTTALAFAVLSFAGVPILVNTFAGPPHESNAIINALLLWLGECLPQHLGLLLPMLTAILGVMYWGVQKQFEELDLPSSALAQTEKAA